MLGASYLRKWVVLGATIGIVAGLGAVAFITALQWSNHFLLGALGGYHAPMRRSWKIVSSAITIGAGGSGGREGPTAQISAGFASLLARRLRLSPADARIAVTVGIGSGIGAIFRAPLVRPAGERFDADRQPVAGEEQARVAAAVDQQPFEVGAVPARRDLRRIEAVLPHEVVGRVRRRRVDRRAELFDEPLRVALVPRRRERDRR